MAKKSKPATIDDAPAEITPQRTDIILQMKGNTPAATIENVRALLDFHGIICRYNIISKQYEIIIPDESFSSDNSDVASLARVASRMAEAGIPTSHYKEYIGYIGDQNQYNPVLQWVTSKPWDGVERIKSLCDTITAKNEHAKNLFIRRWLITCMFLAMNDGADSPGCLVLQGNQGLGKTWWFRKLCPIPNLVRTDASVDPRNRDSISQVIRYWIVELGEIGSTFRRSDIDALKAFITSKSDIIRRPYATTDQIYPRRTALAASVNDYIFLHDATGNRRFFTVQCTAINSYHNIDMQQLWAEVYDCILQGETPHITPEEAALIDEINKEHMQIEPIEEKILAGYEWGVSLAYDWKTATEIAEEIGLKNVSQRETRIITAYIKKLNNGDSTKEKRTGTGRYIMVPTKRIS